MSETIKRAEAAIYEIEKLGRDRRDKSRAAFEAAFKGEKRRPPPDFVPSSFLVIRSHAADNGARPLQSSQPFWLSPAIRVLSAGSDASAATIEAGKSYEIECEIHNRGDLPVPSATVEFFLSDPTIGFDTRYATQIGLASTWVSGLGVARVRIPFRPSSFESGHRCLIARVFSFSPYDLPIDDTNLSPTVDRRVAQLNIHIVASAQPYTFQIVHQPNFQGRLGFRAATLRELATIGFPDLALFDLVDGEKIAAEIGKTAVFKPVSKESSLTIKPGRAGVDLFGEGKGASFEDQKVMQGKLETAFRLIAAGKAKPSSFKELFAERRKMAEAVTATKLSFRLPKLSVEKGTMAAVHLFATSAFDGPLGGITLVLKR